MYKCINWCLLSWKKANTNMNLKGKISYWNDFLPYQDMARVDSSRPSITRSYGPWAKPHPFLPKEFPLLVCSRKVTHSGLLIRSNQSERPQGTGTNWSKQCASWSCGAMKILFPVLKIQLPCMWLKTTFHSCTVVFLKTGNRFLDVPHFNFQDGGLDKLSVSFWPSY